ncbi:MAG: proton-conducting transporter membrane subunit [Bacillota bacterium]|nr:proton-conducting transporter membrane subunit [Bacillota bacterium]
MLIYIIIGIFAVLILSSILIKRINLVSKINIICMAMLFAVIIIMGFEINKNNSISYFNNLIYIDSLSFIQLLIINSVSFITSIYSFKYIKEEITDESISIKKARIYYILFQIFVFAMMFLAVSNNIVAMWIGLEATTLSTAFLIGFNNNKLSIEAAWKYIIICSIGIGIGLVGIVLFIYSMSGSSGEYVLEWTVILQNYSAINKDIVKIAFTLIFVGVGTKAGFAPMHTWLSDGHSEAPSPISAMMSGILINLALYVIVRFYIIVRLVKGVENLRYLFIIFGCISLIIASFSILKQTNYKRLLAFSSIENIGIMSLGFGFGGVIGIFGALLHSIIHAYGKTLLFLETGNILSAYKTKRIDKIKGLIHTMPVNAVFLIIGILVITGTPPFASFFSEFRILRAGIQNGYYISTSIYAFCLLLVFAGFLLSFIKMIFDSENVEYIRFEKDRQNIVPLIITLVFIITVTCTASTCLNSILNKAVKIVLG